MSGTQTLGNRETLIDDLVSSQRSNTSRISPLTLEIWSNPKLQQ